MTYEISKKESDLIGRVCRTYFLDDDKQPLEFKPSQIKIFSLIQNPDIRRGQVETTTQYGKSLTIALGALWIAKFQNEDVAIVAPTDEQANIIMAYVIDHINDHPTFSEGLVDEFTKTERMQVKTSRKEISWRGGGRIKCYTVAAINTKGVKGKKVMGLHATTIIVDEACLIPNDHFSKVFRMLAGKVKKSKIIKIGNPYHQRDEDSKREHHFYKSHNDPRYALIWIDYHTAITEGRLTEEYVQEAKETMSSNDFRVLFEVLFPIKEEENSPITELDLQHIRQFVLDDMKGKTFLRFAGSDISGQGNDDTILSRIYWTGEDLYIRPQNLISGTDLKLKSDSIHSKIQTNEETYVAVGIDVIGVGLGVADMLTNRQDRLYSVKYYIANASAEDPKDLDKAREKVQKFSFYNKKTELVYWFRDLIRNDHVFVEAGADFGQLFQEVLLLQERTIANQKRKIDDPDDSPDHLDSLLAALFASQFYRVIT